MGSFSKNLALLALGFWLGAAVLFAAVVAPTVFNPEVASGLSRNMAAAITSAILRRVYLLTYVTVGIATFFLLVASFGDAKGARGPRRALILCFLVLGLNAVSDLWIVNHMNKIRVQMANAEDGNVANFKSEFDKWHKISTGVYGTAVVFGLVGALFLLPSVSAGKSQPKPKGKR